MKGDFKMEFLNDYLVLVVLGICLCVGYIIKHAIPSDKINRFIPLIMGLLGGGLNIWLNGFTITPEIILGGLLSGLASTGLYELFKQFINKEAK
jgi:hypothetical protein